MIANDFGCYLLAISNMYKTNDLRFSFKSESYDLYISYNTKTDSLQN